MKKLVIGYLYNGRGLGKDEIAFRKIAKKKKIDVIFINTSQYFTGMDLKEKIKGCNIIYNSSGDDFVIEIEKTVEELGSKIIDSTKAYYYTEDKWMFFLKCKEHKIPTPDTILLSQDIALAKKELKTFSKWPVILKRVAGTMGEYVEKADTIKQAESIINKFWKKGKERMPIIAQEYIHSPSYRATVIGKEIVQTAIKESQGWKATGVYAKRLKRFPIDKELKELTNRIMKFVDINVCGIDFLKKDDKFIVLEVNSAPGLDFFECEREKMAGLLIDLLISLAKKN